MLNADDVLVARPMKCAELRVSGLDDSATSEEVALAVSRVGGCDASLIKVGEIRQDRSGLGTAWVRCPVMTAKKVSGSRLLVGFVSARVHLLQERALQCFRCHDIGHVAAKCSSALDRSLQCFRCGQDGHKQHQCSAAPHCPVCEAAGKPSDHSVGSTACVNARKRRSGRRGGRSADKPNVPAGREEVQHMEVK